MKAHIQKGLVLNRRHKDILRLFKAPYDLITSRQVQTALGVSQPTAFHHLADTKNSLSLVSQNILDSKHGSNPALYGLTAQGIEVMRGFITGGIDFDSSPNSPRAKQCIRGHKLGFKNSIVHSIAIEDLNLTRFQDVGMDYDMGWCRRQARFEGDYFVISPKSVIFKPRERFGKPFSMLIEVYEQARQLFKLLEQDNPGLKINNDNTFLIQQEWAFERDPFIEAAARLEGVCSNERFQIDFSKGWAEIDFLHNKLGTDDADKYRKHTERFVHGIIEDKISVPALERVPETIQRVEVIETRAFPLLEKYGEYIGKHLDAIERMVEQQDKANASLDRLSDAVGKLGTTTQRPVATELNQEQGQEDWRSLNRRAQARGRGGNFR